MFPYITIFNKTITSYTIMLMVAIFTAGPLTLKSAKKFKVDIDDMIVFLLVSALGAFIGGHILYAIVNTDLLIKLITNLDKIENFNMLILYLKAIFGGSVFYGGLIGAIITAYIYGKRKKLDIDLYSFIVTPFIPLFHAIGRIGCFLYGCCFGIESKFGFTYTNSLISMANNVNRLPIQLIESGINIIIFIILYILQTKKKCYGYLLYIYLIVYSISRFILEFFRGDTYRGFLFNLSTSQLISIFLFIISLGIIIYKKKHIK